MVGQRGEGSRRTVDEDWLTNWMPIYFESLTSGTTYTLPQTLELYFQTLKHTHTTNVLALTHVPILLPCQPGDGPMNSTANRLTN